MPLHEGRQAQYGVKSVSMIDTVEKAEFCADSGCEKVVECESVQSSRREERPYSAPDRPLNFEMPIEIQSRVVLILQGKHRLPV